MAAFKKYLCISTESSRLSGENFTLERLKWQEIAEIPNLCDYDSVVINLTALSALEQLKVFEEDDIAKVFDPESWIKIITSGGNIFVIGDPKTNIRVCNSADDNRRKKLAELVKAESKRTEPRLDPDLNRGESSKIVKIPPLDLVMKIEKDPRQLEYRRIIRKDEAQHKAIFKYLDSVLTWNYSIADCRMSDKFKTLIDHYKIHAAFTSLGHTSYSTVLALYIEWRLKDSYKLGSIFVLPASERSAEAEDLFIIQQFLGISTSIPEPHWIKQLTIPKQKEVQNEITAKELLVAQINKEIALTKGKLVTLKRWYRLLYDDGFSLEEIIKEALELLEGNVTKTSKVKDDFRLLLPNFPQGVMEVKGTHNPIFSIGALRQLAGWMDEAIFTDKKAVKGFFVGNAGRNNELETRGNLFDTNAENYALIKEIVILRSMDLFCFVILKELNLIDVKALWKELFDCKGSFDAKKYWNLVPKEFAIPNAVKSKP